MEFRKCYMSSSCSGKCLHQCYSSVCKWGGQQEQSRAEQWTEHCQIRYTADYLAEGALDILYVASSRVWVYQQNLDCPPELASKLCSISIYLHMLYCFFFLLPTSMNLKAEVLSWHFISVQCSLWNTEDMWFVNFFPLPFLTQTSNHQHLYVCTEQQSL